MPLPHVSTLINTWIDSQVLHFAVENSALQRFLCGANGGVHSVDACFAHGSTLAVQEIEPTMTMQDGKEETSTYLNSAWSKAKSRFGAIAGATMARPAQVVGSIQGLYNACLFPP